MVLIVVVMDVPRVFGVLVVSASLLLFVFCLKIYLFCRKNLLNQSLLSRAKHWLMLKATYTEDCVSVQLKSQAFPNY